MASSAVTVSVVVDVPSAATVDGEAVSDDVVCDTPPAVKSTLAVSLAVPLISAVTVSAAFASVELSVVVNTPCALVVLDTVPK